MNFIERFRRQNEFSEFVRSASLTEIKEYVTSTYKRCNLFFVYPKDLKEKHFTKLEYSGTGRHGEYATIRVNAYMSVEEQKYVIEKLVNTVFMVHGITCSYFNDIGSRIKY